MPNTHKIQWGILGAGNIAAKFAQALPQSRSGHLLAIASRSQEKADAFAAKNPCPRAYGSYEDLLADADLDAIYISLPNHLHLEWTEKCAAAGKHILCEKPFATNAREAEDMIAAAQKADVFLLEAFMYRCHPQTARVADLLRSGAIGDLRIIQAHFAYNMGRKLDNIRFQNAAAGGSVMDVGCYGVSMTRLMAGAALGLSGPSEPDTFKGVGFVSTESRVDEWATAVAHFPGNILANITCGSCVGVDNTLRLWGSQGNIQVPNPWFPGEKAEANRIVVTVQGKAPETIEVPGRSPYAMEADVLADQLAERQAPAMTWADSLGNMRCLDRWRRDIGLVFDNER